MIITCPTCNSKYKYDEKKLEGSSSKKVKCPKCKGIIEVMNESLNRPMEIIDDLERTYAAGPQTAKPAVREEPASANGPSTVQVRRDALLAELKAKEQKEGASMPQSRRFSLAVIQGSNSGEIFQITKPQMVIGRTEADIIVKDLEASRQHARIEIVGDRVLLRDLNSTNGTYVDEQKISLINLENQSEFRIGTTVLMLIITELE